MATPLRILRRLTPYLSPLLATRFDRLGSSSFSISTPRLHVPPPLPSRSALPVCLSASLQTHVMIANGRTIAEVGVAANFTSLVRLPLELEVPAGRHAIFVALTVFTFPGPDFKILMHKRHECQEQES